MEHARRVHDKLMMRPPTRHFGWRPHARDYEKSRAPTRLAAQHWDTRRYRTNVAWIDLERANGVG
jgi:hypothetical protein